MWWKRARQLGWLVGLLLLAALAPAQAASPEITPVPVLSAGMGFIPFVDGGQTTLVTIVSPVLLVPIKDKWLIESRAAFEGDFTRQNGAGPLGGPVAKELEYLQLDYIANRYVTLSVGRFLTPFGIYNERLYPVWIRDLQPDPMILPIGTQSSNGAMLRGGFSVTPAVNLNYAAYFSVLATNETLASERWTGGRVGVFLPRQRLELGVSLQHSLQETHDNRVGAHFEWQPRRIPFDVRSEFVTSEDGRGYWIEPALRLTNLSRVPVITRHLQLVARVQQFFVKEGAISDELPPVDTQQVEFGLNYYLRDGLRATASYGRQFSSESDRNIWTVGLTYRFAIPLGRGGMQ
ncbi:MAG TPA: hypothetical protein VK473_18370 [Terriglobales bacterium]|nr:hypothetical protein [Terriglobales bacterium]